MGGAMDGGGSALAGWSLVAQGIMHMRNGHADQSRMLLSRAVDTSEGPASGVYIVANTMLGTLLNSKGMFRESATHFQKHVSHRVCPFPSSLATRYVYTSAAALAPHPLARRSTALQATTHSPADGQFPLSVDVTNMMDCADACAHFGWRGACRRVRSAAGAAPRYCSQHLKLQLAWAQWHIPRIADAELTYYEILEEDALCWQARRMWIERWGVDNGVADYVFSYTNLTV